MTARNRLCARLLLGGIAFGSASRASAQVPTLDTVRVAARAGESRAASPRTVEIIDASEIARRPGYDLADILSASLGVDVDRRSPAQADVSIRGSSLNQVVILVDGARVSDLQSGHYDLDLAVPMSSIDHIEILRGGDAAMYGADAVGGVVNIVTRSSVSRVASVHGGTFGDAGAALAVGGGRGGHSISVAGDASRSDGHRSGTDYRAVQSRVAASQLVAGGLLSATTAIGVRDFGATDFYGPYPSYEDTRTSTATVDYRRDLGRGWVGEARADTRRHHDLYTLVRDDPTVYQNRHLSWQTNGGVTATDVRANGSTVVGIEGFDATLTSARLGDHAEHRASAFAEERVGSGAGGVVVGSMRADWSSRTGGIVSPNIAVTSPAWAATRLRVSGGTGFRAPTWTELYYSDPVNIANPDLGPEHFWMGEVGARSTPTWGVVDASVFERHATDLIDWLRPTAAPATVPWQTMNIESATFTGVEMEAGVTNTPVVEWRLAASRLRVTARGSDSLTGKYALTPITESTALTVRTKAAFRNGLLVTMTRARRAAEQPYWKADAQVRRTFGTWTLRVDGLNLTNANFRDASAQRAQGRTMLAGFTIHPEGG